MRAFRVLLWLAIVLVLVLLYAAATQPLDPPPYPAAYVVGSCVV